MRLLMRAEDQNYRVFQIFQIDVRNKRCLCGIKNLYEEWFDIIEVKIFDIKENDEIIIAIKIINNNERWL